MAKTSSAAASAASKQITKYISETTDWRGTMLAQLRKIVLGAAPQITEEWKWGTPVWSQNGLVCSVGAFKEHVKLTFFKGASLPDPKKVLQSGPGAKSMRSIDLRQGDKLDQPAIRSLVKAAVALNHAPEKK